MPPSAIHGTPNFLAIRLTLKMAVPCARPTAQTSCTYVPEEKKLRKIWKPHPYGTRMWQHLCGAYGAAAHSDTNAIHPSLNEVIGLARGHNISTNQVHTRVGWLDVLDHVNLVGGIALRWSHPLIKSVIWTTQAELLRQALNATKVFSHTCDESMMITSAPASINALHLSLSFGRVPIAAPTKSCLFLSFDASGNSTLFLISIFTSQSTFHIKLRKNIICVKDLCGKSMRLFHPPDSQQATFLSWTGALIHLLRTKIHPLVLY